MMRTTTNLAPAVAGAWRRAVLRAACALALGLAVTAPAHALADDAMPLQSPAEESITIELLVLHGTNDGTGIDKELQDIPELKKPPFSSYNSYKRLQNERITLKLAKGETRKLPNDRQILITYKGKKDQKFTIGVAIQKPNGPDYLPQLDVNGRKGDRFFVAGQSFKGGMLAIGVKILN